MSISSTNNTPSFIIDSTNRLIGTATNFSYKIDIRKNNEYDSVCLILAEIPKTYYTLNSPNNTFYLTEDGFPAVLITMLEGNYNIENFLIIMKDLLDTNSPNSWIYTVGYPDPFTELDTGKITYTVIGPTTVQPILTMIGHTIHKLFGFGEDSINTFVSGSLTSTKMVRFQYTDMITIKSNICSNYGNSDADPSILARIPTSGFNDGETIKFIIPDLYDGMRELVNVNQGDITIIILDSHNQVIDLNGSEIKLTLLMFKHNEADEKIINLIKQLEI